MVNELKNLTMKLFLAYNWPYILKNTLERAFFVHQISLEGRIVHKFIVSTTQMDEEITMYTVSYSLSLCQLRIITLLELSEQIFRSWKKCVQLSPRLSKHKLTSPKGFLASKCDVGNWIFSKS